MLSLLCGFLISPSSSLLALNLKSPFTLLRSFLVKSPLGECVLSLVLPPVSHLLHNLVVIHQQQTFLRGLAPKKRPVIPG